MTSATTFVLWGFNYAITDMSLPYNTIGVTYNVPGGSPFYATVVHPDAAGLACPVEVLAQAAASIPGCAGYAMIPILATDGARPAHCECVAPVSSGGRPCYVEVGNEPWNTGFFQGYMFNSGIAQMAGSPLNTAPYDGGYALNATQHRRNLPSGVGRGGARSSVKCTSATRRRLGSRIRRIWSFGHEHLQHGEPRHAAPARLDHSRSVPRSFRTGHGFDHDLQAAPTVAATVVANGGGTTGISPPILIPSLTRTSTS